MLQALIYTKNKKGYTNFTEFVFESRSISNTSIQKYLWSISDGTLYYNVPKTTHKFFNSGTYIVKLTVWDEENKQQSTTITVNVQQFLSDTIYFHHIPKRFVGPGQKTETPITVSFTTTITGRTPVISLYADNSRSIPYTAPIKPTWNELIPRWTFYDLSGNAVTELTATNYTPVYFENTLIGYRGNISFYFTEDIGINDPFLEQPTLIFATLKTTTQENSRLNSTQNTIQKATFWYTDKPIPTNLKISETIVSDIYRTKWSGVKIPYLVAVGWDKEGYKINTETPDVVSLYPLNILKRNNSTINFSYPDNNTPSLILDREVKNTYNVLPSSTIETAETSGAFLTALPWGGYSLSSITPTSVKIDFFVKEEIGITSKYSETGVRFYKHNSQGYPTAGFAFDFVRIHSPIERNVALSATLMIPATSYTPSFFDTTYLNVYNPEVGLLNSVFCLPHTNKNLTHNKLIYDKILETEWIESTDLNKTIVVPTTANYKITNPHSVAYDPVDQIYWVADPDTNHIYKLNNEHYVLTAIDFISYFDTDPRRPNSANRPFDRSAPIHVKLDKNREVWISFYDELSLVKLNRNGDIIRRTVHQPLRKDAPAVTNPIKERNLTVYSLIDVDSQNNIWATHTEYLYNELRKYSSTGVLLSTIILPTLYSPTSIHIDTKDNIWLTTAVTPYLLKPSQDRYGHYWDWHNLKPQKNSPLRWRDTRFVGLTNWVVEREIYPAGKYPKTWNRETFNGESLKTNYTFTLSYSSRTEPISSVTAQVTRLSSIIATPSTSAAALQTAIVMDPRYKLRYIPEDGINEKRVVINFTATLNELQLVGYLSAAMLDVTAIDTDYKLELMRVSSVSVPVPSNIIVTTPVSALNVFYKQEILSITPPITAKINMTIPSSISKYWPGLYNTETNYITAGTRIIIEVPQQKKVYNYLPGLLGYGTTKVNRPSSITTTPFTSATTLQTVTAMNPSYSLNYLDGNRVVINFTATLDEKIRTSTYPVSVLPLEKIISGYEPGLFFRIYNYDYYIQNVYSFANTFSEFADYRYNTISTSSGTKIDTNFFTFPAYLSENNLITNQISSVSDPITSVRQVIPTNYGTILCFNSGGTIIKNYNNKFSRPESLITDNTNNVWFTHNYNHFTYLDPSTDKYQTWKIDADTGYIFSVTNLLSSKLEPNSTTDPTQVFKNGIRGLHVDMFNRVWLVSNNKQKIYTFYAPNLTKYYRTYNANLHNSNNESHRLTQSFGDPTGNVWFRRYVIPEIQKTSTYVLTGLSNLFKIQPFTNKHQFRVKNESFDAKEQIKSYALPEVLNSNTILFDDFIGSILGNVTDDRENIGRTLYEKIANFTRYHNDIDFANINSLYSLGQMLDVEIEQGLSKLKLPAEIKRLLNFTSIPYKKLFGYSDKNTDLSAAYLEPINTEFSFVTAGEILLFKEPITRNHFTYIVPVSTSVAGTFLPVTTPIPYSILKVPQLQNYMFNSLEVYRVSYTETNNLNNTFIDWYSPSTKLLSGTTVDNWYKDEGTIEEMFNYVLTKNLLT